MKSSEMVGVYVGDLIQNVSPRIGEIDVVWLGFKIKAPTMSRDQGGGVGVQID